MISYRSNSIGDPGATVDVTLCRNNFIADPGALQYMQYMGASVDVTSARDGETPGARPADRVPVAVRSIAARRSKPQTSTQSPWRTGTGAGGWGRGTSVGTDQIFQAEYVTAAAIRIERLHLFSGLDLYVDGGGGAWGGAWGAKERTTLCLSQSWWLMLHANVDISV